MPRAVGFGCWISAAQGERGAAPAAPGQGRAGGREAVVATDRASSCSGGSLQVAALRVKRRKRVKKCKKGKKYKKGEKSRMCKKCKKGKKGKQV